MSRLTIAASLIPSLFVVFSVGIRPYARAVGNFGKSDSRRGEPVTAACVGRQNCSEIMKAFRLETSL